MMRLSMLNLWLLRGTKLPSSDTNKKWNEEKSKTKPERTKEEVPMKRLTLELLLRIILWVLEMKRFRSWQRWESSLHQKQETWKNK